jgi:hypothetical protein
MQKRAVRAYGRGAEGDNEKWWAFGRRYGCWYALSFLRDIVNFACRDDGIMILVDEALDSLDLSGDDSWV